MNLARAHKDAVAIFAVKVALALNRAIVLAVLVVELDTDPYTRCERGLTDEEHFAVAEITTPHARV